MVRDGKAIRMREYDGEIEELVKLRKKAPDGSDWAKGIDNRLKWLREKLEKSK